MKEYLQKMLNINPQESKSTPPPRQLLARESAHLDIFAAARTGVLERIREIIMENEINPGSHDLSAHDDEEWGYPALYYAIENGHADIVQELIEAKAYFDPDHGYYLCTAIKKGHAPIVQILLAAKATPNLPRFFLDRMPIHVAIANGHRDIVRILIAAKAELDILRHGDTPISFAARKGDLPIVRALLDAKAILQKKDGPSALHVAAEKGHLEVVRELLTAHLFPSQQDKEGRTPLYFAIREGHVAVMRELIRCRANVNATIKPSYNETESLLLTAVKTGNSESIEVMLNQQIDLNPKIFGATFYLGYTEGFTKHLNALKIFLSNPKTSPKGCDIDRYIRSLQDRIKHYEHYPTHLSVSKMQAFRDALEICKAYKTKNSRLAVLSAFNDRLGKHSPLSTVGKRSSIFEPKVFRLCFSLAGIAKKPDNKNAAPSIDDASISGDRPGLGPA